MPNLSGGTNLEEDRSLGVATVEGLDLNRALLEKPNDTRYIALVWDGTDRGSEIYSKVDETADWDASTTALRVMSTHARYSPDLLHALFYMISDASVGEIPGSGVLGSATRIGLSICHRDASSDEVLDGSRIHDGSTGRYVVELFVQSPEGLEHANVVSTIIYSRIRAYAEGEGDLDPYGLKAVQEAYGYPAVLRYLEKLQTTPPHNE